MNRAVVLVALAACGDNAHPHDPGCDAWHQWGNNAAHSGDTCVSGQPLQQSFADIVFDPFVPQEALDTTGDLIVHYQVPLLDQDAVYMMQKGGTYTPCERKPATPPATGTVPDCFEPDELYRLDSQIWSEVRYSWHDGALAADWQFDSDWTPEPGPFFEPMFQPVVVGSQIAIPGAGGTLWELDAVTGKVLRHVQPPGFTADTYVAGALAVDAGIIYYNAVALDHDAPQTTPARAWLVAVAPDGGVRYADYADLVGGAPRGETCYGTFQIDPDNPQPLPPPDNPDGTHVYPMKVACGPQVPGINTAPAFAADGTVFVATHAQFDEEYSYLSAVNPGTMSANWSASLRGLLYGGCGIDFACANNAQTGVDPYTNMTPAAFVDDDSSSTPVALPDGGVLYGALDDVSLDRGHLLRFTDKGAYVTSYNFGWDSTPALAGDEIIIKDNNYISFTDRTDEDPGPYYITALDSSLDPVWQFENTNTESCTRAPDGSLTCVSDHPKGFEWCVNAPAVDADGVVYANSEDGNLYAIAPDGTLRDKFFLDQSIGAAYTPVALDHAGRIFAINNGHMMVVAN